MRTFVVTSCILIVLLIFQNCGGNFNPDKLLAGLSASSASMEPLTYDPLATGKTLSGSVYARDPFTSNSTLATGIIGLNNSGYLQNAHLGVRSDTMFPNQIAKSFTDFTFTAETPQFRQTNAYYHTIRLVSLYKSLGYPLNYLQGIRVNAHCEAPNNAYYSHSDAKICLGYSLTSPIKYASSDADVIIHEMNHAVNRRLVSPLVFGYHPEMQSADEGISDFWANVLANDDNMSEYFGRAIYESIYGYDVDQSLRTATPSPRPHYPESLKNEVHSDGVMISMVLWTLRLTLPVDQVELFKKAVIRSVENMQTRFGMKHFAFELMENAQDLLLDVGEVERVLTNAGLLREDNIDAVTANQVVVIDEVIPGSLRNGNCNGVFEAGEQVLAVLNLQNGSTANIGSITADITSVDPGLRVLTGGEIGYFLRLKPSKNFMESLPTSGDPTDLTNFKYGAILSSAFALQANAPGTYNLTAKLRSFNSITGETYSKTLLVPITVTSKADNLDCSDRTAWP